MITNLALAVLGSAVAVIVYAYIGYPLALLLYGRFRPARDVRRRSTPRSWPKVSISLPVYNEAAQIRDALESLLTLDYPPDKRQIVVVSDASDDGTDAIVSEYASRGVELIRQSERRGKTAAENAACEHLDGDIVVNTDASIRVDPDALKRLVAAFDDPSVGLASGRDVSVGRSARESNAGESGYVGYEMWVRSLETRAGGIVGASGCLYAIRTDLHRWSVPEALSRDFAAALVARERGYRAVSVEDAVCVVPRARSLRSEYRRKVRTMTRGMETLLCKRDLLRPFRYGAFSWMLFSHKVCRWLAPWAALAGGLAVAGLAVSHGWARWATGGMLIALALGVAGWLWPTDERPPGIIAFPGYGLVANVAAMRAAVRVVRRDLNRVWEPTRREPATGGMTAG